MMASECRATQHLDGGRRTDNLAQWAKQHGSVADVAARSAIRRQSPCSRVQGRHDNASRLRRDIQEAVEISGRLTLGCATLVETWLVDDGGERRGESS
ncbi:hypothetical protein O9992_24295 [Vibrio lentus]|nr:hypothetical protein [Vibrio lentus]